MLDLYIKTIIFEQRGYFFAKKFLVFAPVALAGLFKNNCLNV
jgi:uncharacterized membrane protein YobD (UPF0266 family)